LAEKPDPSTTEHGARERPKQHSNEPAYRRERPNVLARVFYKIPVHVYVGPVALFLKWRCVMRLTTVGRKSGKLRTTGVSFMPLDGKYIIFSGWGTSSDWYKNLRANPRVKIKVGTDEMRATARLIEDPERRRELMLKMQCQSGDCGPPKLFRPILKAMRIMDYEGELEQGVAQGGDLPVLEIIPAE
jgi:deazaflavin-dependent oxidoreductase (nitroreductase family)